MITIIDGIPIEEGSGNVYVDLGYPDAEEMLVKAGLVAQIEQVLMDRELTIEQAAKLIGRPIPWLSDLVSGKFRNVSRDAIGECLSRLQ